MKNSRINTLFVAIGTNPFDSLLQAIDTPSFYDALIKNSFNRIVFQCPNKDYFAPLFHKEYEDHIAIEIYGTTLPADIFIYKRDVVIASCDVGVLIESHQVKVNLIAVIEETDSVAYEIFCLLKRKPSVLGLKGTQILTGEFIDSYLSLKSSIGMILQGQQLIPGEEYRPPIFNNSSNQQLVLLKQSLDGYQQKYLSQERHLAVQDEEQKSETRLYLNYLNLAFDPNKLNSSLMRHPQFRHLEHILRKNNFLQIDKQNPVIQSKSGDVPNIHIRKFSEEQASEEDIIEDYTKPKEGENEEDYFERIRRNYNPYFYLELQDIKEQEFFMEIEEKQQENTETSKEVGRNEIKHSQKNDGERGLILENTNHNGSQNEEKRQSKRENKQLDPFSVRVGLNNKVYNTDFSNQDPLQMLKKQDAVRAQEAQIRLVERTNNELDELVSSIEKKEVVQMIKDEYETKTIKGAYRVCSCPYCKRLLVPFLIRKDFDRCYSELNDIVLQKHRIYFDKVMKRYQLEDINIEQINNLFFREYKTSFLSLTSQLETHGGNIQQQQQQSFQHQFDFNAAENNNGIVNSSNLKLNVVNRNGHIEEDLESSNSSSNSSNVNKDKNSIKKEFNHRHSGDRNELKNSPISIKKSISKLQK